MSDTSDTSVAGRTQSPSIWADPFERIRISAIDAALEAVVTVDDAHRIVMVNPAALRMFGYTSGELLGRDMACLIPERLRKAHTRHVKEFDRSGAIELPRRARNEMIGLRANGEEFPVEASVSRVDMADGVDPAERGDQRRYFTVLLRDISREMACQAELDTLNQRLRAVFDLAPVAIWITIADRIVYANRACAALFGSTGQPDLVGRSVYELLEPTARAQMQRRIEQVMGTGEPASVVRERILSANGQVHEVDIAVASLPDHGETALQMVITDLTEQRREHAEAMRSRAELQRLSASLVTAREDERRRIARELHDELGQWLTVLKMELNGLTVTDPGESLAIRVTKLSEMVDEIVRSMRRIAMDLRPLMLDDLGLNAAIEWLARDSAQRIGLELKLALGSDDPPVGAGQSIALYRMTQEALTNIARHAQASRVEISLTQSDGEVVLTVADDGIGFDPEKSRRADSQGLIGIRERAYMFGGELETGNRPEGGAFMRVRLPLTAVAAQVLP